MESLIFLGTHLLAFENNDFSHEHYYFQNQKNTKFLS